MIHVSVGEICFAPHRLSLESPPEKGRIHDLGALKQLLATVLSAARNAACLFLPLWTFAVVTDHAVIPPRDVINEEGAEKVMGDSEVGIVVQQLLALTPLERSQPPNTV